MMTLNYGVCPKEVLLRGGYGDVVQHTGPVISGQLRSSFSGAQTLRVSFGYSQAWYNSFGVEQTLCADFIAMQIGRNSLMGLNSGESPESAKHEQYSGSEAPSKFVATCTPGMRKTSHTPNQQIAGKKKGRTANPTLWDACFFNHQENQFVAEQHDNYITLSDLVHRLQPSFSQSQNHTGISGEVQPWRRGVLQKFRKTSTGATYKTFVGDRVTGSKPVQPSGSSLDFLRCLRLISPCMAVTMNCPVVSPSCFTDSIASTTSWGARACTFCDLLFTWSLCTTGLHSYMWNPVYIKKEIKKGLKWNPVDAYTGIQLMVFITIKLARPRGATNTSRASNHNVIGANTMACQHSTQTRPKFVFLFLGTPNEFPNTTPTVLRVEADTEDEGRAKFIGWTLIFAAQIRTEAPCRLQLFSTDEGFMWVYEQRQSATEVCHA